MCDRGRGAGLVVRAKLMAAAAAAVLITTQSADAQFLGSNSPWYGSPFDGYRYQYGGYGYGGHRYRSAAPADPYYFRPQRKRTVNTPGDPDDAKAQRKRSTESKKDKKEAAVKPPPGPLLIAIALNSQRLTLYSNGAPIAHSPVSTGTASHPTPSGIFSVIGKEKFHRSNLYSNAPMPWMQRITWSGVALHQGVLPGYPASHGCIRLPDKFARYLYATTRMGARVIITRDEVSPFDIAHAKLFAPKPKEELPVDQVSTSSSLKVAESDSPVQTSDAAKSALNPADNIAGANPAARARNTGELSDAIDTRKPSPTAVDTTPDGAAADSIDKKPRAAAEVKDRPRMSEPVSVFISRKTGRLYVRQGFEPMFDVPVTIRDPEQPLGTHLYTAVEFKDERAAMRWVAVQLSGNGHGSTGQAATEPSRRKAGRKNDDEPRVAHVPASTRAAAAAALERIQLPPETVERISDLLSPGASLIISDLPMSAETGKYTDFIILTR
jgi:lipoprotein-anchoring transpeptidase ErfK/SrfK